jgi:FkbM family methyltransferase
MFLHQGIWLPDGEKHFVEWMNSSGEIVDGKGTYQIKKFRAAMEYVKNFRVAVDVGGHVGFWSMHLANRFKRVYAFEPMAQFRECFKKNITEKNVTLCPFALGESVGNGFMKYNPADSGGTHLADLGEAVEIWPLDEWPNIGLVDFMKIDCEGYEHLVIEGARETILSSKPCIIVEQKRHILERNFSIKGTPALDLLKEMGGTVQRELSGDFIVTF